jgi:hypothetical protein
MENKKTVRYKKLAWLQDGMQEIDVIKGSCFWYYI